MPQAGVEMGLSEHSTERMQAFAELLHENHRGLFSFIYSLVHNYADAEDVYQQAALIMWRKFDDFELGTNFSAWSAQVARNAARDFLKSKRRQALCFSDDFIESIQAAYQSRHPDFFAVRADALEQCLEKLSQRDRELLKMFYSPDRDMSRISSVTRRSIAALYQAISRIRKNLSRCVQRSLATEG